MVIHTIGEGVILPGGDGKAEFNSVYTAIVMKPVRTTTIYLLFCSLYP